MDRIAHPPLTVKEAKQQLRSASSRIDYLAPIKNHPLEAAGAALLAGLLWKRLAKSHMSPGLLALGLEVWKAIRKE